MVSLSNRNAVGFDINPDYIDLCHLRLAQLPLELPSLPSTQQIATQDDARNTADYLEPETVKLLFTSPPYANLLNRRRKNKSRRGEERFSEQYGAIEQYSQDPRDLGTLGLEDYQQAITEIFAGLLPLLKPLGHCVINVVGGTPPDMWWEDERITLHIAVVEALRPVLSLSKGAPATSCATRSSGTKPMSSTAPASSAGPPTTAGLCPPAALCAHTA